MKPNTEHTPAARATGWGTLAAAVGLGTVVVVAAVGWSVHREVSAPAAVAPGSRPAVHAPATASPRPDAPQVVRDGVARLDASRLFELGYGGGLIVDQDTRAALELVLAEHTSAVEMEQLEAALRSNMPKEEAERVLRLVAATAPTEPSCNGSCRACPRRRTCSK